MSHSADFFSAAVKGPILVAAAVIESPTGEILMAQRPIHHKLAGGQWEFPGGKIEPGEAPQICLKREIREELGVEINVGELVGLFSYVYKTGTENRKLDPHIHVILAAYRASLVGHSIDASRDLSKFKLDDVASVCWLSPLSRPALSIAPADVEIVDIIWSNSNRVTDLA